MKKRLVVIALATLSSVASAQNMNRATDAQVQAYVRKFVASDSKPSIQEKVNSARERASTIIGVQACSNRLSADRILGKWVAPGERPETIINTPIYQLQYHDKNSCLSVDRIDNFTEPAKNALSFRVAFVSDSSGESIINNYTLVRQADGAWLITKAADRW